MSRASLIGLPLALLLDLGRGQVGPLDLGVADPLGNLLAVVDRGLGAQHRLLAVVVFRLLGNLQQQTIKVRLAILVG